MQKMTLDIFLEEVKLKKYKTEEELRVSFRDLLRDQFAIKIDKLERYGVGGRTDLKFLDNIIELKKIGKLSSAANLAAAIKQVKKYKSKNENIYLFDGTKIVMFDKNNIHTVHDVNKSSMYYFCNALKNSENNKISFSMDNIMDFLSPESNDVRNLLNMLLKSFDSKHLQSEKFSTWRKLFSLAAATDTSDDKSFLSHTKSNEIDQIFADYSRPFSEKLFVLQTYYSFLIKHILYYSTINLLKANRNKNSVVNLSIDEIESGLFYIESGIYNYISEDLYSWYLADEELKDLIEDFSMKVLSKFNIYDLSTAKVDVLNLLYEAVMPHSVRKSLGEYYTPYSFAKEVYNAAGYMYKNRIVDPTCGSGTFISVVVDEKINNDLTISEITESVAGIDLNPLAVLSAKVNLLIKLLSIRVESEKIFLPIYCADSTKILKNFRKSYLSQKALIIDNWYKPEFGQLKCYFSEFVSFEGRKNSKKNYLEHIQLLPDIKFVKAGTELIKLYEILKKRSTNFEEKFSIQQDLLASTVFDFDGIIGNPPWVKWSNLPSKYRQEIKNRGVDELFSPYRNNGGNSLDLFAPILWASSQNFLSKDGKIAMIMPMSLNFNSSMENVRKFKFLNGQKISKIYDYSDNTAIFKGVSLNFGIYVIDKSDKLEYWKYRLDSKTKKIVSSEKFPWRNEKSGVIIPFESQEQYKRISKFMGEYDMDKIRIRSGVQFSPNKLRQFYIENEKNGIVTLSSSKIRKIQKSGIDDISIKAEKKSLIRVIRTTDLKSNNNDWTYSWWLYEDGTKNELEWEEVRKRYPVLSESLDGIFTKLQKSESSDFNDRISKSSWYGNTRVGEYTQAPYRICFADNGEFKPTLITNKRWIPEGHVRFIPLKSKKEALRIFNILNSKEVKELISLQSLELNRSFLPIYFNVKLEVGDEI